MSKCFWFVTQLMFGLAVNASNLPSVARHIVNDGGDLIYIVNERAPSLSAVARELYGDRRMANEIARWNGLPSETWLKLGDRLKLQKPPRYSDAQGTALLIRYWHIAGRPELVARLKELDQTALLRGLPPYAGGWLPGYPKKSTVGAGARAGAGPRERRPASVPPSSPSPQPGPRLPTGSGGKTKFLSTVPAGVSGEAESETGDVQYKIKRKPAFSGGEEDQSGEPKDESYWLGNEAERIINMLTEKLRRK